MCSFCCQCSHALSGLRKFMQKRHEVNIYFLQLSSTNNQLSSQSQICTCTICGACNCSKSGMHWCKGVAQWSILCPAPLHCSKSGMVAFTPCVACRGERRLPLACGWQRHSSPAQPTSPQTGPPSQAAAWRRAGCMSDAALPARRTPGQSPLGAAVEASAWWWYEQSTFPACRTSSAGPR